MKGAKGVNFNDRELAASVRTMTLNECIKWLKKGKGTMYAMVLNNLSRNVLPRLSEVTGEDGKPIIFEMSNVLAKKHGIDSSTGNHSG